LRGDLVEGGIWQGDSWIPVMLLVFLKDGGLIIYFFRSN